MVDSDIIIECYDVGGTNIRGALVSTRGEIIQLETVKSVGGPQFIDQIEHLHSKLQRQVTFSTIIGLPGPVRDNILLCAPPLKINEPIDLKDKFPDLPQPVQAFNDLYMAAHGELIFGAGQTYKNFCLVTISTGIGTAFVLGNNILAGSELGHNVVETDPSLANPCLCGREGCWVAQASGYAIQRDAAQEGEIDGIGCSVAKFLETDRGKSYLWNYLRWNARGLGMINNVTNLDAIVVMGSVGLNQFEKIIPPKEDIEKHTINLVPPIMPTSLGDNIGLLGGAAIYLLAVKLGATCK